MPSGFYTRRLFRKARGIDVGAVDIFRNRLAAGVDVPRGGRAHDLFDALGAEVGGPTPGSLKQTVLQSIPIFD